MSFSEIVVIRNSNKFICRKRPIYRHKTQLHVWAFRKPFFRPCTRTKKGKITRDSTLSKQAIKCYVPFILRVALQCQKLYLSERCNSPFRCGVIFYFNLVLTNPFYALPVRERSLLKTKKTDTVTRGWLEWRKFEKEI